MNILTRLLKKRLAKKPGPAAKEPGPVKGRAIKDEDLKNKKISKSLEENLAYLESIFGQNIDFAFRKFRLGTGNKENACLIYLDSLTGEARISESILEPLMLGTRVAGIDQSGNQLTEVIGKSILTAAEVFSVDNMLDVFSEILYGGTGIFIDGCERAVISILKEWPQRSVEKADVEGVVRGPKESFTETIGVNTALVRRRLRTPNLVIEGLNLGRVTNTSVAIAYLAGVVSPELVQEVKRRLNRIDIDGILESGYIEAGRSVYPLSTDGVYRKTGRGSYGSPSGPGVRLYRRHADGACSAGHIRRPGSEPGGLLRAVSLRFGHQTAALFGTGDVPAVTFVLYRCNLTTPPPNWETSWNYWRLKAARLMRPGSRLTPMSLRCETK